MFLSLFFTALSAYAGAEFPITVQGTTATVELKLAYGPSLPGSLANGTEIDTPGLSRANGGERFFFRFRDPKVISEIRISAYSRSGKGQVVMRNAVSDSSLLKELFQYADMKNGTADNYNGLIRLSAGDSVTAVPAAAIKDLTLQAEAFADNDTTLYIEFKSPQGFTPDEFMAERTATGSSFGSYIEELAEKLSVSSAQKLMSLSRDPATDELAGTAWVCSVYDLDGTKRLELKTRHFVLDGAGRLGSYTENYPEITVWVRTEDGLKIRAYPNDPKLACGSKATFMILRKTPGGSTVVEYAIDKDEYFQNCMAEGISRSYLEEYLRRNTINSAVNSRRFVTNGYEFCRPARFN